MFKRGGEGNGGVLVILFLAAATPETSDVKRKYDDDRPSSLSLDFVRSPSRYNTESTGNIIAFFVILIHPINAIHVISCSPQSLA